MSRLESIANRKKEEKNRDEINQKINTNFSEKNSIIQKIKEKTLEIMSMSKISRSEEHVKFKQVKKELKELENDLDKIKNKRDKLIKEKQDSTKEIIKLTKEINGK